MNKENAALDSEGGDHESRSVKFALNDTRPVDFGKGGDRHCRVPAAALVLKPRLFVTYAGIVAYAIRNNVARVSQAELAEATGCDERTVRRAIGALTDGGFVHRSHQGALGRRGRGRDRIVSQIRGVDGEGEIWLALGELALVSPRAVKVYAATVYMSDNWARSWTVRRWADVAAVAHVDVRHVVDDINELIDRGLIAARRARDGGWLLQLRRRKFRTPYDGLPICSPAAADEESDLVDHEVEQLAEAICEEYGDDVALSLCYWAIGNLDLHGLHAAHVVLTAESLR